MSFFSQGGLSLNVAVMNTSVLSKFSPPAKMPEMVRAVKSQCENAENVLITFVRFQYDLKKKRSFI